MSKDSWRKEMIDKAREVVQQSGGAAEITMDELSAELIRHGSTTVPANVEADLKKQIQNLCFP